MCNAEGPGAMPHPQTGLAFLPGSAAVAQGWRGQLGRRTKLIPICEWLTQDSRETWHPAIGALSFFLSLPTQYTYKLGTCGLPHMGAAFSDGLHRDIPRSLVT